MWTCESCWSRTAATTQSSSCTACATVASHCSTTRVFSESALREALAEGLWDVALVDFSLPGFGGLEALHVLSELAPDVPAITVSGVISDETAVATMAAGAVDYVLKDNLTRLAPAVERAVAGAELRRRERRAAEEARQSKFAVDHASQAIVYVSEDGVILYANEAAGRLAGVAPGAAMGRGIWGWYPHLSREGWSELWRRAVQGPVADMESVLMRARWRAANDLDHARPH